MRWKGWSRRARSLGWFLGFSKRSRPYDVVQFRFGCLGVIILSEAFHLQVFCYGEERVEFFLGNIDLAVVHEVEYRLQVSELHALEVEEWVLVRVLPEDGPEEG